MKLQQNIILGFKLRKELKKEDRKETTNAIFSVLESIFEHEEVPMRTSSDFSIIAKIRCPRLGILAILFFLYNIFEDELKNWKSFFQQTLKKAKEENINKILQNVESIIIKIEMEKEFVRERVLER